MWTEAAYRHLDTALHEGLAALSVEDDRVAITVTVSRALQAYPPLLLTNALHGIARDINTGDSAVLQRKILRTRRLLAFYVCLTLSEYDQTGRLQHAQRPSPLHHTIQ